MRFLLCTRSGREIYDDDSKSILQSQFDSAKFLKVVIHKGYKGSGSDIGAILTVQFLLDLIIIQSKSIIDQVSFIEAFIHVESVTMHASTLMFHDICIIFSLSLHY